MDERDDPFLTRPMNASDPQARLPGRRRHLRPLVLVLSCVALGAVSLAVLVRMSLGSGMADTRSGTATPGATATAGQTAYMAPLVVPGLRGTALPTPIARPPVGPTPEVPVPHVGGQLIFVSVAQQWLWAYQDGTLVYRMPVTTGMPQLPTPPGQFRVRSKATNVTFYSPWPPGSPYYYPPEHVNFALYFADDGYYLHDATWRRCFGPGTEGPHTCPDGTTATGSHGGVDLLVGYAAWLYGWARVGARVDIADVPPPLVPSTPTPTPALAPTASATDTPTDVPATLAPPTDTPTDTPTDVPPTDTPTDPTPTPED